MNAGIREYIQIYACDVTTCQTRLSLFRRLAARRHNPVWRFNSLLFQDDLPIRHKHLVVLHLILLSQTAFAYHHQHGCCQFRTDLIGLIAVCSATGCRRPARTDVTPRVLHSPISNRSLVIQACK